MKISKKQLIGPFSQIVTLNQLALRGPLLDEQLEIIANGGILVQEGKILNIGKYQELKKRFAHEDIDVFEIQEKLVVLPGFIDAHTHICFAGKRAKDFALRNAGSSYQEILASGGGIWNTVQQTRKASEEQLITSTLKRANQALKNGITTIEIKSGYGLSVEEELKMLRAISKVAKQTKLEIVPTCLAAHVIPKDFDGDESAYLEWITNDLLPIVLKEKLTNRFDIFVEKNAFTPHNSKPFLGKITKMGFDLCIHADQFTVGASQLAIDCKAISADHLEASGDHEIKQLAKSKVIAVALPGASLGLGCDFAPCRKLLDQGCSVAIASDWNPGSAPMGNLLLQASVLACYEKLTTAEVFSGLCFRAAAALKIENRGKLKPGFQADFIAFPTDDYRDILYNQGQMTAKYVWKFGELT